MVTPVDPRLSVERRASPPGYTGETPVTPPCESARGHGLGPRPQAFQYLAATPIHHTFRIFSSAVPRRHSLPKFRWYKIEI